MNECASLQVNRRWKRGHLQAQGEPAEMEEHETRRKIIRVFRSDTPEFKQYEEVGFGHPLLVPDVDHQRNRPAAGLVDLLGCRATNLVGTVIAVWSDPFSLDFLRLHLLT
jgi:hypothetical protein